MGMYTGMRCSIIVKDKYRKHINDMVNLGKYDWGRCNINLFKGIEYLDRASFIPWGALSYMDWDEDEPYFKDSFNVNTGEWKFQCSMKNYESTLDIFIQEIVPEIAEKIIHLERRYEENDWSTLYNFSDKYGVKLEEINLCNETINNGPFPLTQDLINEAIHAMDYFTPINENVLDSRNSDDILLDELQDLVKERKLKNVFR